VPLDARPILLAASAGLALACGSSAAPTDPRTAPASEQAIEPSTITSSGVTLSPATRDLPRATGTRMPRVVPRLAIPHAKETWAEPELPLHREAAAAAAPEALAPVPAPIQSFDAIGDGVAGFSVDGAPADPNGDVGPNHYVSAVNVSYAVYGKTGALLAGPTAMNGLWQSWAGSSNPLERLCATENQGDPVVLYDRLADRWFLTQFAFALNASNVPIAPFAQCVAVSQTADPTGAWYLYAFGPMTYGGTPAFNDYGKFGVWSDAYYATYNMFAAPSLNFRGTTVCAMDRAKMLAGQSATQICFDVSGVGGTLPATIASTAAPPPGAPGLVATFDGPTTPLFQLWRAHADFANPGASSITGPTNLSVPSFTLACPSVSDYDCAAQPGTSTKLDTIGDRLMMHLAYRNYGGLETLLATHTVDEDGSSATDATAVRWYEVRNAPGETLGSGTPVLFQTGTVRGNDGRFRFNQSLAMDAVGNIAVGYTLSGPSTYPSLAASGRLVTDAPGAMSQTETVLYAGQGSQTTRQSGTPLTRWGDYSALTVDPTDDCTFWYTNEYLPANGTFNWRTRVVSFRYATCAKGGSYRVTATVQPSCSVSVDVEALDASGAFLSTYAGQATLTTTDPAVAAQTLTFSAGLAHATVAFTSVGQRIIYVRDVSNLSTSGQASVGGGAPVDLVVAAPAQWTAGTTHDVTVTAVDACGAPAAAWAGPATLVTTDPRGTVGPLSFSGGTGTASVRLETAGARTLSATTSTPVALSGSATTTVAPGRLATFAVTGPATARAGDAVPFAIAARDPYGNTLSSWASAVWVSSADANQQESSTGQSVTLAAGTGQANVTFTRVGTQTVTVKDLATMTIQGTAQIDITAAPRSAGCGCGAGGGAGLAALLPLAMAFVPRRRRAGAR
jgi:hypothetical protein